MDIDIVRAIPMFSNSEDRPEHAINDLDKLYQAAILAYRREDGNACLQTSGTILNEPDRLVFIVEGKKAATEAFEAITDLMRLWDGE